MDWFAQVKNPFYNTLCAPKEKKKKQFVFLADALLVVFECEDGASLRVLMLSPGFNTASESSFLGTRPTAGALTEEPGSMLTR